MSVVKRALISVADKTGIVELAIGLHRLGVEILSTGGTAELLQSHGIPVTLVSDYTGFPEILDGRVKTLQPAIYGGLLALRDQPCHMEQLAEYRMAPIDLVAVNLYPFEKTVARHTVTLSEALENIDIGGPCMLRAAAKNFRHVVVVCQVRRYADVLKHLEQHKGSMLLDLRRELAVEAFATTAAYDQCIHQYLEAEGNERSASLPSRLSLTYTKKQSLRYGENPHQSAAFYATEGQAACGLAGMTQLHGKELSFNNILDLQAALAVVRSFREPTAVVIKHNNPTGMASAATLDRAYRDAWQCDPMSAFGGIIGLNRSVDVETAGQILRSGFMECVLAPSFARDALKLLQTKKNLRLVRLPRTCWRAEAWDYRPVDGGLLVQSQDSIRVQAKNFRVVSRKCPGTPDWPTIKFGWEAIRPVKSNAIILVKGQRTVGIGCGQTSRIESVEIAIKKAGAKAKKAWLISDAFIPKVDNIAVAAAAGIKGIVQTGGSVADNDVVRMADERNLIMVMTGKRHFKH